MYKIIGVTCAILALVALNSASAKPSAMSVREQQTITIKGVKETWRLVWIGKHLPVCDAKDVDMALTCPCSGLAYGEYGNLWLVRTRNGREVERMDLRPLFGHFDYPYADNLKGKAALQTYPVQEADFGRAEMNDPKLAADIRRRPKTSIMHFADFDRDGHATEFLLQIGTLPCGKLQYAAVGVSTKDPHLHAFHAVNKPDTLLEMPLPAWQALLNTASPTNLVVWECGDHGSEVQSHLIISARNGRIRAQEKDIRCSSLPKERGYRNGAH
ncbi:MAG: hypothetical protein ACTHLA_08660 [Asticcacaulis sp.]|uniref:hypothetical protein n=1 Tax=Asticcacaulis sp. TaxID=1872648 RepID=UPI003F7CACDF